MWILKHKSGDKFFYLNSNKDIYNVGRNNADIQLKEDSSISRAHAKFILTRSESNDKIVISDSGSKYGTFVNEGIQSKTALSPNVEITLKHMDCIKFGILENTWTIIKANYITATSTLSTNNKAKVINIVQSICGSYEETWSNSCTHLTMDNMTLTIKLVQALIAAAPIVTTKFWEELSNCFENNIAMPKEELYIPIQAEPLVKNDPTLLLPNQDRRKIFSGKTFVFLSSRQYEQFHQIIKEGNGTAALLEKLKWTKSKLCQPGVIIIQYLKSSHSQLSQATQIMDGIEGYMNKKSCRLIPESEIGLAVLYCSTEKYCNPAYDFKINLLRPSLSSSSTNELVDILAEETEQINTERINIHEEKITSPISINNIQEIQKGDQHGHVKTIVLTKCNTTDDVQTHSPPKEKTPIINVNNSIISFNKTQKRKIDSVFDDKTSEFNTDSPKRKCLDGDESELFGFETDDQDPTNEAHKKNNRYENAIQKLENISLNVVTSPPAKAETTTIKKLTNNFVKPNISTILHESKSWLSCYETTLKMDISDQKNDNEQSSISCETQEWISQIREGISIQHKSMFIPNKVYYNNTTSPEINYKRFKKTVCVRRML